MIKDGPFPVCLAFSRIILRQFFSFWTRQFLPIHTCAAITHNVHAYMHASQDAGYNALHLAAMNGHAEAVEVSERISLSNHICSIFHVRMENWIHPSDCLQAILACENIHTHARSGVRTHVCLSVRC